MKRLYIPLDIQRFAASMSIESSVVSQDVNSNTSVVRITVKIWKSSGSTHWYHPNYRTMTVSCDGQSTTIQTELYENKTSVYTYDFPIGHNADGTKSISYSASIPASGGWSALSASGSATLPTIPRTFSQTPNLWVISVEETKVTYGWSTSENCSWVRYHYDNSAGWHDVFSSTGTSGSFTINNGDSIYGDSTGTVSINPASTHNVKVECRRADSNQWSYSNNVPFTSYSYPYCTIAPDFTIGGDVTLQFYNPLGRTVDLQMWSHVSQDFINASRISAKPSHNQNYTFPASNYVNNLYQSIPNNPESKYNIDVWYSGNKATKVGGKYSVNVNTCKPTFEAFTWEDINVNTVALTGSSNVVVQKQSNIQAIISVANKAEPKNSATITNYEFKCGNKTSTDPMTYSSSEDVTGTIIGVESNILEVRAVDSRGIPSDYVTLVAQTYIPYENLSKGSASISRSNGVSEQTSITFSGDISLVDFGETENSITSVVYEYKKSSDAGYTTGETSIVPTIDENGHFTFTGYIKGDTTNGFDVSNVYTVVITVSDELTSVSYTLTLNSGIPHVAYHKNGISIMGRYNTSNGGKLQIAGVNIIDIFYPVGSYYETSDTNFDPNTAWGGTWKQDSKGRVTVGIDTNQTEFNTIGKYGGHKEMQQHSHSFNSNTSPTFETLFVSTNATFALQGASGGYGYRGGYASIGLSGNGDSGNLPPYVVVVRWHRTA